MIDILIFMRRIRNPTSLKRLDASKDVRLYLERYLKGETKIPIFDSSERPEVKIYTPDEIREEFYRGLRYRQFLGWPYHVPSYILELGQRDYIDRVTIGLVGKRHQTTDGIQVVSNLTRPHYSAGVNHQFFVSVEEYWKADEIVRGFGLRLEQDDKLSYVMWIDERLKWAVKSPKNVGDIERRVNNAALAIKIVMDMLDEAEPEAREIGRRYFEEGMKKYGDRHT